MKFERQVNLPPLTEFPAWLRQRSSIGTWEELETWLPEFRVQYVFPGVASGTLPSLVELARRRDPTYDPPRFENYLRVAVPARVDGDLLADAFRRLDGVELTYVEPPPNAPPVDSSNDPKSSEQGYLEKVVATNGAESSIDARTAWGYSGGDGAGQAFVDLERGWLLDHDDLVDHVIEIISGINEAYTSHGTSVLGIVAAKDNTIGIVGIAPEVASVRVVGYCRSVGEYDLVAAIESAISNMEYGDVLLIEADNDYTGYMGSFYYGIPVEAQDGVYEAIRLGTALGIVVVEAGGDDEEDLDAVRDTTGAYVFRRSVRDSGALLVGAASSTWPHRNVGNSSHGERIDFFAWGENVFTLADDPTTASKSDYEEDFEATSAAAAIIAGAALVVQGMAEASLGHRLGPGQLRVVLAEGATPLDPGEARKLGVMPNLGAIIAGNSLRLAPDVYARDYVGDDGDVHTDSISESPDVIVTTAAVADPQTAYGEGSGTEDSNGLGYEVKAGVDQYVYVRARNRGGTDAVDVEATVYWAEVATLITPDVWKLIGTTTIPKVPSGDTLTVSDAIVWPAADVPTSGHYCFIATVGHEKDPVPKQADLVAFTWDEFNAFIRNNNNVTWRNFNIVAAESTTGEATLDFTIPGPGRDEALFGIEIEGRLPRGATLALELPVVLARGFRRALLAPEPIEGDRDRVRIPLVPWTRNRLGEVRLGGSARYPARIRIRLPREARGRRFRVVARQTYKGREVGRVTWVIESSR